MIYVSSATDALSARIVVQDALMKFISEGKEAGACWLIIRCPTEPQLERMSQRESGIRVKEMLWIFFHIVFSVNFSSFSRSSILSGYPSWV